MDVLKILSEKAKKTTEDTSQSPEVKSRLFVLFSFEKRLSAMVLTGDAELSMAIDDLNQLWVLNSGQPAFFRELRNSRRYEHMTRFYVGFLF